MQQRDYALMCQGVQAYQMTQFRKYLSYGTVFKFFKDETIVVPEDDNYIYYITKGGFKIEATCLDGSISDVAYCYEGTCLQANKYVLDAPYLDPVRMIATENSIAVRFTRGQFYTFIQTDRDLFDEYVDNASVYAGVLRERLLLIANVSSGQRLLTWLEKLCMTQQPDKNGVYTIPSPLTQQEIANLLFIHITTCNKFFAKLNNEKIAAYSRGKITVYNLEKLQLYRDEKLKLL